MTKEVKDPASKPEEELQADLPVQAETNEVARAGGEKLIEVSERASVDEEYRKELAKRIR